MSISGLSRKGRNRERTARLKQVMIYKLCLDLPTCINEMNQRIDKLCADLATSKEETNQQLQELRVDLINLKENTHQRVFTGAAMTRSDQEDLRHLIGKNHKEIQRQSQQMQAQIDRLHAERYSGNLEKDSDTDGILRNSYGWRRYFGIILWVLTIAGLIFGCGWNIRELLKDMMESPTVTKLTFTLYGKLSLPPISVYQSGNTPMLHTEKLFKALENGTLTETYLEVFIKGIGIRPFNEPNITVKASEITEIYKQAILRYGSLTEAGLAFQKEYGMACNELFTHCAEMWSRPMNCCDIFEFLWGHSGLQYALKRNTIFLAAFQSFYIRLRSFPNIKDLQKGESVHEPGNYQSYLLGIGNDVDQTGYDAHTFEIQPSDTVNIMLYQKRRNLKVSKDCLEFPPKLRYFRDYTISNCYAERCILDKLPLCNISCEIPLFQLLNPDNFSGPPCEFDVLNSQCWVIIQDNLNQCKNNHGCRLPCNHTEVEYSVTKKLKSTDEREIVLIFQYATTEVQTFEETSRLTKWEYLGLISSILDLWLGISTYSLYRLLHRCISKVTNFKAYAFGKCNSAAVNSASNDHQHEMANLSETERHRRIRSSNR